MTFAHGVPGRDAEGERVCCVRLYRQCHGRVFSLSVAAFILFYFCFIRKVEISSPFKAPVRGFCCSYRCI